MAATLKIVVVGDGAVGKTCMLVSYATNEFPTKYVPTIFETYTVTLNIKNKTYNVGLFDTAGQEDYDCLRPISYPNTNVFLVCYSVMNPASFENVREQWIPELKYHAPKTPYILVGTQIDLRDDHAALNKLAKEHQRPITELQGEKLAKSLGAMKYVECSARTQLGLKIVFDEAILAAMSGGRQQSTSKRCIML